MILFFFCFYNSFLFDQASLFPIFNIFTVVYTSLSICFALTNYVLIRFVEVHLLLHRIEPKLSFHRIHTELSEADRAAAAMSKPFNWVIGMKMAQISNMLADAQFIELKNQYCNFAIEKSADA